MKNLQSTLVDSHAHLDAQPYSTDLDEVIARAKENRVAYILTVGCDLESSRASVDLAIRYPNLYASVGIHPHDASLVNDQAMAELARMIESTDKVVAVGETGLDFYRDRSPRDQQEDAFRRHIQLAKDTGKPLIIHDRDAHDDVVRIMQEENAAEAGGVLHCFSGDLEMAKRAIDLGFYISISGPVTYRNARQLPGIVRALPLDRLLVETDCPFLAPEPYRGKRNEPAHTRLVAERIAELKGISFDDLALATTANAQRLFELANTELEEELD